MMKGLKASLHALLSLSLVLGSVSVYADDITPAPAPSGKNIQRRPGSQPQVRSQSQVRSEPEATTPHGYNSPAAFCNEGAGRIIEQLDKSHNSKLDDLKKELLDLEQQRQLIMEVRGLQQKYQKAIDDLAKLNEQDRIKKEKNLDTSLTAIKTIIRNGMTLNALALLLQNTPEADLGKKETYTLDNLCKNDKNKTTSLCVDVAKDEAARTFPAKVKDIITQSSERDRLDKTLVAFFDAQERLSKPEMKKDMRAEVAKILNDNPPEMKPERILKLLYEKAPETSSLLSVDFPKDKIMDCLSEMKPFKQGICQGILKDSKQRTALIHAVTNETNELQLQLSEGHSTLLKEMASQHKAELEANIKTIMEDEKVPQQRAKAHITSLTEEISDLGAVMEKARANERAPSSSASGTCYEAKKDLSGLALLFFDCDDNTIAEKSASVSMAIEEKKTEAKEDEEEFNKQCRQFTKDTDQEIIKGCTDLLAKIIGKITNLSDKYNAKISALRGDILALTKDGRYSQIETMKKYVAEKYLRTCNKKVEGISYKNDGLSICNSSVGLDLITIQNLGGDVDDAIKKMTFGMKIDANKPSKDFPFTTAEMDNISKTCAIATPDLKPVFKEACSLASRDVQVRASKKDVREAMELNDKYWVDYNPDARNNYTVTKKKSALRIVGEGMLPVLPTFVPMWFNNYQTKQNISMLTDQAIMQKQMLHTFDVYNNNPWMYNYNYFSSNPYGLNTASTSGGFNFGL